MSPCFSRSALASLVRSSKFSASAVRRAYCLSSNLAVIASTRCVPVEQPTKFEMMIKMKTANALNLSIPQSVMMRADQVLE